ncbi:hypothetical protein SAMN04488003_10452 [Loktanella fryxellensis]|uniref:Uncharacterized protein n=1 Tax=Loktanella fryxellensis TaxID=245187 RepID=A0A1H8AV08_9RHOB|nr:hypothetical protein [Loktanella fryxellensis]SEM74525.1 hypothetical protein SAMN04488003_10452 [Loktanella fryxellensis]
MRFLIALSPLVLLAACATPQQQCLSNVTQDLRVNAFLIAQTQANLDRGFAIDRQQRVSRGFDMCRERNRDGSIDTRLCPVQKVRTVNVPQAINLTVERDTLNQLLATRANLERRTAAATAQCRTLYPE